MKMSYFGELGERLNANYEAAFKEDIRNEDYSIFGESGKLAFLCGVFDGVFAVGLAYVVLGFLRTIFTIGKFIYKLIKK